MRYSAYKRAFYTLARCIAALALCTAGSLALLLPLPAPRVLTVPGVGVPVTVQLPGRLARGDDLPLAVLWDCDAAPLMQALAARGIAAVRADGASADEVGQILLYMQAQYGTARAAAVGGAQVCRLPQRVGGLAALVLWQPAGADEGDAAALRACALPTLAVAPVPAELSAAAESLPQGQLLAADGREVERTAELLAAWLR